MSDRYPHPRLADLPQDIREAIEEVTEKSGFTPNVFLGLARRPAEFRAFFAYYSALMDKETGNLSVADREMIVTATSARNDCLYCVVAHGAVLRIRSRNPRLADQLAVSVDTAELDARQRAILDFAVKVQDDAAGVGDADIAALAVHGLDAEDAWDIGAITAFFGLSNRMAGFTGMRPNEEFYLMGRIPREG